MYRISEDKSVTPDNLLYADLNYTQNSRIDTHPRHGNIGHLLPLSDHQILSTETDPVSATVSNSIISFDREGNFTNKPCLIQCCYYTPIIAFSENRVVSTGCQNGQIYISDLSVPAKDKRTNILFAGAGRVWRLIKLSETTFASVSLIGSNSHEDDPTKFDQVIKIWDLTQSKKQECIKTLTINIHPHAILAISETKLLCALKIGHSDYTFIILDLMDLQKKYSAYSIDCYGILKSFTILPNNRIAYSSSLDEPPAFSFLSILDVTRLAEDSKFKRITYRDQANDIKKITNSFESKLFALTTIAPDCIAGFTANGNIEIYRIDCDNTPIRIATLPYPSMSSPHLSKVVSVKDGRFVVSDGQRNMTLFSFKRARGDDKKELAIKEYNEHRKLL